MGIPVIDLSKLNGEDRETTLSEIANGCEEWGFFQLVNHGISVELLNRVKMVCSLSYKLREESFYSNSEPVKMLNELLERSSNEKLENVDWEDVFTLLDDNEWPSQPQEFKETMEEYRGELKKLAEKVMEAMDENLGLPAGYIKNALNGDEGSEAFFGTKVSHYPPCPRPELVNGLRAHTDAGGVILLFQDDKVGGLQILKDDIWVDVQPLENSIVINTGDQIEVLSNGKYKSVLHRVLAGTFGNRRSIASFYNPSFKATIAPAPQLTIDPVTMEVDQAYPKFVFGNYMSVYAEQKFSAKEARFRAVGPV